MKSLHETSTLYFAKDQLCRFVQSSTFFFAMLNIAHKQSSTLFFQGANNLFHTKSNFKKTTFLQQNIAKNNVNIAYFNLGRNRECLYFDVDNT